MASVPRNKGIKNIVLLLLAVFAALPTAACGAKPEAGTLRYIGFNIYDPVYVAQDRGLFAKHGVKVEIIELLAGGPSALQAIAGGSAEACVASYMAVINARTEGLPVVGVSDIQSSIGDQALEEFFVRRNAGIESVADLRGKKIAVNLVKSSFHYTWQMALAAAGMTEDDMEFVVLPFDQQELALENGSVDAIGMMPPYVGRARRNAELTTLFTALDIFGERQFTVHAVNSDWAENNPALAEGFVSAVAEASAWIEDNQSEAKIIISKYTGVAPEEIDDYRFQPNAAVVMEDARYWLDYLRSAGEVTGDGLTAGDFATNRYNRLE